MCDLRKASGADLYVLSVVEAEGHCERELLADASKDFCLGVGEPYPNDPKLESHLWKRFTSWTSLKGYLKWGE